MEMTNISDFENIISELDTNRFGFKIAILNYFADDPPVYLRELKKLGVKLIISRIDGKDIELINILENLGFRIKDTQLTYRYDLNDFEKSRIRLSEDYFIREAEQKDIPSIIKFTGDSFKNYGHYYSDRRLDEKKCAEIYKDWALRSCLDKNVADKVFVAVVNNQAIGFLTFKIFEKNKSKYAAGGLGAVSSDFRNKSVFQSIAVHGLEWGAKINLEWIEHNVLTTNNSVNRAFSKLGFKIANSYVTLHCWLD